MNYQPAPQLGDRIIDLGIPQYCSNGLEFEQAIRPISHEHTDMFSSDATHRWYDILDTEANRRELTAIVLQFPEIQVRYKINEIDPDFLAHDGDPDE
jgi:hypothetical protein